MTTTPANRVGGPVPRAQSYLWRLIHSSTTRRAPDRYCAKWIQNLGGVILVIVLLALIILPFRNLAMGRIADFHSFRTKLPAFNLASLNILRKMGFGALGGSSSWLFLPEKQKAVAGR
jgi:hypothetical protein